MKTLITGGAGFLGQLLAQTLLKTAESGGEPSLTLADVAAAPAFAGDPRVTSVACDISDPAALARLVTPDTAVIYHLAAVVSGQAEAEFDLGLKVNLDATRLLLELARRLPRPPRFIFTSSLAVFGGDLPEMIDDRTATTPQSSYGTEKAMAELLINDYSRKGFVDGRVLRLPTISVRPGKPNKAASSFASGIIREPLNGQAAVCPVRAEVRMWLSSPQTAVANLAHARNIPAQSFGYSRTVNSPGLSVTVAEMLGALEAVGGRAARERVRFERDEAVERIIASWPGRFDTRRAAALGFAADHDFEAVVRAYHRDFAHR